MRNIKDFRSEINNNGVLKTNRFFVTFKAPNSIGGAKTKTDLISLRCEAVQWPGVSFTSMDTPPRVGYGASEVIPVAPIFQDVNLTFLVDKNSNLHRFFFNWTNSIINLESRGQSNYGGRTGRPAYEVGYKNDYVTDINIDVYRENGETAMTATLFRAFPRSLPSFDLNWANNDEALKISVEFTYTDYFIDYKI